MLTRGQIPAIVFDDALGQLGALTHTRPVFDIRTGALSNLERLALLLDLRALALRTPDPLAPTSAKDSPGWIERFTLRRIQGSPAA